MCKPDMRSRDLRGNPVAEAFDGWRQEMIRFAECSNVYMKVSGGFSEMPALLPGAWQGASGRQWRFELMEQMRRLAEDWLRVILTVFGPRRMMFGSDWPVCNIGGGGNEVSWMNWWLLVKCFVEAEMSEEDQACFWSGNALRAYGRSD